MIRAILFDYGRTLVSFSYPRAKLLAAMELARTWLPAPAPAADWIFEHVLMPLEDGLAGYETGAQDYFEFFAAAWHRAGLRPPRETLLRILNLEQSVWDDSVLVAPGAHAALEVLRAQGLRLGIASNAPFPAEMLHRQLRRTGFAGRVDAAVFSSEIGVGKPDPRFYAEALQRLGARAEEALYVGDQLEEDYWGPRRAGLAALICTGLSGEPTPDGVPAISSLSELPAYLEIEP